MASLFRQNRRTKLRRNPFNLSHDVKLTTEFGRLTPILCKEVVPGDTWRIKSEMLIRTAPLYAPLMHRVNAYVHFYFVPSRLLMKDWDTFISGGENGDDKVQQRFGPDKTIVKPYMTFSDLATWYRSDKQALYNLFGPGSLWDFLGFPAFDSTMIDSIANTAQTNHYSLQKIDLLPFFAYNLIYNEYYRDETFEDKVELFGDISGDVFQYLEDQVTASVIGLDEFGQFLWNLFRCKQRNWEKDYFTSALNNPQRGGEVRMFQDTQYSIGSTGANIAVSNNQVSSTTIANNLTVAQIDQTGLSVNELRRSLAVQKFRERMARYGVRYTEFLRGVFGVSPSDARLQRPEFLGGFKQQLQFGEVLQTSESTDESPQGAYAGTGFSLSGGKYLKNYFNEHGYIIGILSIMPKPAYMQGFPREFNRFSKYDYYIPDFAHIGEQEILKQELRFVPNVNAANVTPDTQYNLKPFGYIPRYAEYKFCPSRVCGEMRTTLDYWHLARRVSPGQALNNVFLELHANEMNRVFNYTGDAEANTPHALSVDDHFWVQIYHDIKAIRPMPKFGTPLI